MWRGARQANATIDGDIHPSYTVEDIKPWPDPDVYDRVKEFGLHAHAQSYPRVRNGGGRLDSRAADQEGTPLSMFQRQLLDEYKERIGVIDPDGRSPLGPGARRPRRRCARRSTISWCTNGSTLSRGSFCTLQVPMEHPEAAVAEIERYKNDKRFVQILMSGHQEAEIGDQKYLADLRSRRGCRAPARRPPRE